MTEPFQALTEERQQVIAMALLAGCVITRQSADRDRSEITYYIARMPDGVLLGKGKEVTWFADEFVAASACVHRLNKGL